MSVNLPADGASWISGQWSIIILTAAASPIEHYHRRRGKGNFFFSEPPRSAAERYANWRFFSRAIPDRSTSGGGNPAFRGNGKGSVVFGGESEETGPARGVSWEGSITTGKAMFFESAVEIDPYDLAPLEPVLRAVVDPSVVGVLSGLAMGGRITMTSDFRRFSYAATDFRIGQSGVAPWQFYNRPELDRHCE
jgi:hypothetical protein